ncbi:hypothetical protein Taro_041609 [Colocasia esculenta]|uniref:Retrotransposon gag domain-containing protein n=1 Tax=Colocasia esculenta TaxID=4460 RepID=A0A843WU24_COLES|nr:hypothetical protein [Colocasia esculenta]
MADYKDAGQDGVYDEIYGSSSYLPINPPNPHVNVVDVQPQIPQIRQRQDDPSASVNLSQLMGILQNLQASQVPGAQAALNGKSVVNPDPSGYPNQGPRIESIRDTGGQISPAPSRACSVIHSRYHSPEDSVLVVGGTDTSSRHWSPASPFPVPHSREPGPGSPEVSGMGLRPLRPVRGRWTRIKYVISLTGLAEAFRHSWYQSKKISGMTDRRDWGGGGDDPEESTQRRIERIWESLTDIRARMDQQAPVAPVAVPPGDGEVVLVAPVPLRVEVPFAAPVPPPPPVLIAEEPVMQVEKFLRLQPPTYSGRTNPDTAEHWVHEIERVFATMRCPAADRVVLVAYQLRGFALEWWRLKMQTTFVGRTEEAITWSEFLDVRARRTFHDRRPAQSRAVAVQGQYL